MSGIVWRGAAILVVLVAAGIATGSAQAGSWPGSSESLRLSASEPRQAGHPITVTVEGVADGAHRLFVYGGAVEHGCGIEHVEQLQQQTALTPAEGEALAAGSFVREYQAVPMAEGRYIVCAYLDAPPTRFPDAWEQGCFSVPSGECYESLLSPAAILTTEALVAKVRAEEEQKRTEQAASARAAEEAVAAEMAARVAHEQARLKAEAERCHVPRLLGHSLSGAKKLLRGTHCRLGSVTVHRQLGRPPRIVWQHPGRGGDYAPGTRVSIRLG